MGSELSPSAPGWLSRLERQLALDPRFGTAGRILGNVADLIDRCLALSAARSDCLPTFRRELSAAAVSVRRRILTDPIIRAEAKAAVEELRCGYEFPVAGEQRQQIWSAATALLRAGCRLSPLEAAMPELKHHRASPELPFLWTADCSEQVCARRFREIFHKKIQPGREPGVFVLRSPDEEIETSIFSGWRLLEELLPNLARNIVPHVHVVALVDVAERTAERRQDETGLFDSATNDAIPGAVFVSRTAVKDPWLAAEALFHEGLHNKMYDLYLCGPILRKGYDTQFAQRIVAKWADPLAWDSNAWPYDRALAAFHFYAHLTVFCMAAKLRLSCDRRRLQMSERLAIALARTRYLGAKLRRTARGHIDSQGVDLIDWLLSGTEEIARASQETV